MKKKILIPILAVLILAILFVPIPTGIMKDGGTRSWDSLTYKIVKWRRISPTSIYTATRVYWGSDRSKPIDELWERELPFVENVVSGTVVDISGGTVTVEPFGENPERITFGDSALNGRTLFLGDYVRVKYTGQISNGKVNAVECKPEHDLRGVTDFRGEWLNKGTAEKSGNAEYDVYIDEAYDDCFFAVSIVPMPDQIKVNEALSRDWCVGDKVHIEVGNVYYDSETRRTECDLISIRESTLELDPNVAYKPVIYLYPEAECEVSVKLSLDGELSCTYPDYGGGWLVTASPDGTLRDERGQEYNYLYWEGETNARWDMTKGACVRGEDTAAFLEGALDKLGLTRREANEFIVFWLPIMQENPYNVISFQTDEYTDAARLEITPKPDTLIRVFMAFMPSDSFVELEPQELTAPERTGFTAVEWGGCEIK